MRRALVLGLAVLSLSGCLATSPQQWQATGGDDFTRSMYYCKGRVGDEGWRVVAFGGVVLPIVYLAMRPGMFRECMEAQGYRQASE